MIKVTSRSILVESPYVPICSTGAVVNTGMQDWSTRVFFMSRSDKYVSKTFVRTKWGAEQFRVF